MDNDTKTKEYLEKLKAMKLSDSSRARIEGELREYARFHGVKEAVGEGVSVGQDSRSIGEAPKENYSGASSIRSLFILRTRFMTTALIIIALALGGGTSFAAEGAVPGDFLYPVKVQVNENVKAALAVSNSAQAELDAELVAERLKEAETLKAEGTLSAEAKADISARVQAHYDDAKARAAEADAAGDYETSANTRASLEGSLRAHAGILTDLGAQATDKGTNVILDVRNGVTNTIDISTGIDASGGVNVKGSSHADDADTDSNATVDSETRVQIDGTLDTDAIDVDTDVQGTIKSNLGL